MILHFSHIGFTDGRTFMIPFGWPPRRGGSGARRGRRYHAPGAVTRRSLPAPSATEQDSKASGTAGPPAKPPQSASFGRSEAHYTRACYHGSAQPAPGSGTRSVMLAAAASAAALAAFAPVVVHDAQERFP